MSYEIVVIIIFVLGYLAIALEHNIKVDKAAPALLIAVLCWTVYIVSEGILPHDESMIHKIVHGHDQGLLTHLAETSQILFFLLCAMTIVEVIDAHQGFEVITKRITTKDKRKLIWIICWVTFFLSAALDNLATTIVMVSMLRKLVKDKNDRLIYVSMVVIAANAGGAWSPIGDVTTTMLWIGGQVTTTNIISKLMLPSIICLFAPLTIITFMLKGDLKVDENSADLDTTHGHGGHAPVKVRETDRNLVFGIGLAGLLFVPIFKTITHLPPFMGMSFSLGIIWLTTEILHNRKKAEEGAHGKLSVVAILERVDVPSVLFFFGILLAVGCLQSMGTLNKLAAFLDTTFSGDGGVYIIGLILGLLSAIVDNVPLVAAGMGMYDISTVAGSPYAVDGVFWEFIAYCAGTGGSTLIIGSAAGVAAMGMEHINFMWYLKKIAWLALIGYIAGAAVFMAMQLFLH
ncbi:sodium:proton antiporter NhaD [Bernardetia sp.]|uniref:sodium:proton antiporter NhaD n=1 Tax=Bernardetia sp. TaxID=1937974 RepID=UPI0025C281B9|nr:sodium:proton antiporter NhaD [Bernardetia sp.]